MTEFKREITADHLADFRKAAEARLNKDGGISNFNYALAKVLRRTDTADKKFNTEVMNIRLAHGSVDDKGNLLKTPQGAIVYTPEAQQEMNDAILDLSNTFKCEVNGYHAKKEHLPSNLSAEELTIYGGLVISEDDIASLLAESETKSEASVPKALPGAE